MSFTAAKGKFFFFFQVWEDTVGHRRQQQWITFYLSPLLVCDPHRMFQYSQMVTRQLVENTSCQFVECGTTLKMFFIGQQSVVIHSHTYSKSRARYQYRATLYIYICISYYYTIPLVLSHIFCPLEHAPTSFLIWPITTWII